jgi:hypothetical protein
MLTILGIVASLLSDNFRLYHDDRGRHELASARGAAQALGRWHTLRVVVVGDRIQGLARMNDARLSQATHGARRPRGPRYQ